ncbi:MULTISPECIES: four helix bundle protein [unclassified Microcoleus]|uniref:four helix bundle protein n=1 Tax=unclassified Microcoleus TaxID=2642155 RepID=UPI002FD4D4A6
MKLEPAKNFQDLIVWQKSHKFVLGVYKFTSKFPTSELYGLTSQFRRAAVSIAANIAEGFKKQGLADKMRFLNIAQGSLEECRYYLILSEDLNYRNSQSLIFDIEEVSRLLDSYYSKIRSRRDNNSGLRKETSGFNSQESEF